MRTDSNGERRLARAIATSVHAVRISTGVIEGIHAEPQRAAGCNRAELGWTVRYPTPRQSLPTVK